MVYIMLKGGVQANTNASADQVIASAAARRRCRLSLSLRTYSDRRAFSLCFRQQCYLNLSVSKHFCRYVAFTVQTETMRALGDEDQKRRRADLVCQPSLQ